MSRPPVVFEEGAFVERPPLSGEEAYDFPAPLGVQRVQLSLHSEVATLPLTYRERGIRRVFFKINGFGLPPEIFETVRAVVGLGLAADAPVQVRGAPVVPRELLAILLSRLETADPPAGAQRYKTIVTEVVGTEVVGTLGGKGAGVRIITQASGEAARRMTGSAAAIGALWLASGRLSAGGVYPPEQLLDPEEFFQALADRGIETRIFPTEP